MKLEGVIVATVTPFENDGKVSLTDLNSHLKYLADAGVNGFVPCGTTGEVATLNAKERSDVIGATVQFAQGKGLCVIAGCGSNSTETSLQWLQEAKTLGAEAGLVVTPYYNKPSSAGLLAHYRYLADHSPIPIVMYNVPGRTSVALSVEVIHELFKHPNIVALKEACGQWSQWHALSYRENLKEKVLMSGDDDAMAPVMALGGTGVISASANVAPRPFVEIFQAARNGEWEKAFDIQRKLYSFTKSMFIESNPGPAKYALSYMGKMKDRLRLPLVPVTEASRATIVSALRELELAQ